MQALEEARKMAGSHKLEDMERRVAELREAAVQAQKRAEHLSVEAEKAREAGGFLSKIVGPDDATERMVMDAAKARHHAASLAREAEKAERDFQKASEEAGTVAKLLARTSTKTAGTSPGGGLGVAGGVPMAAAGDGFTAPARRLDKDDAEAIKRYSQENQSTMGWFRKNVLKAEPKWPRRLYLNVIGCSALPRLDVLGSCDPYVRITNATTRQSVQTKVYINNQNPTFDEVFVLSAQTHLDTIVLEVYNRNEIQRLGKDEFVGAAILPLDPRFICQREVALELLNKEKQMRGVVRIESFWVDEARPKRESGDFYYKVAYQHGVALRHDADLEAPKLPHVMQYGEIFKAVERVKDMSDGTIFVRVAASSDKWSRSGWCFETMGPHKVLERVAPPRRVVEQFFYRVSHSAGARLYQAPDTRAQLLTDVMPHGTVIEASEKVTPVGSDITYVRVDINRGFIFERSDASAVMNKAGEPLFEVVPCPTPTIVSEEQGIFVYRVTFESGVFARASADIVSAGKELLPKGTCFVASAKVLKRYPGIGDVLFVRRSIGGGTDTDGGWVRATKAGLNLLERINDRQDLGHFMYLVVHENGVVVRAQPDLNAPPSSPQTVMPVRKMFAVSERLTRAEDIAFNPQPTVFLRLADGSGWVFERRGGTRVAEDVTSKAQASQISRRAGA